MGTASIHPLFPPTNRVLCGFFPSPKRSVPSCQNPKTLYPRLFDILLWSCESSRPIPPQTEKSRPLGPCLVVLNHPKMTGEGGRISSTRAFALWPALIGILIGTWQTGHSVLTHWAVSGSGPHHFYFPCAISFPTSYLTSVPVLTFHFSPSTHTPRNTLPRGTT